MKEILGSMNVSASAMRAQGTRLRVISENLANASSTSETAGGDPYRRKTISFANVLDKVSQEERVVVRKIGEDPSPFRLTHDPSNPAADADGNVKLPNVNVLVELTDMREAQRSYEANVQMVDQAKSLILRTVELLRS